MTQAAVPGPLALTAELTYRCPLRCVYCSNPVEMSGRETELATAEWMRVFGEGRGLGIQQLHLTGGEPLARPDALELVRHARGLGYYVNLITSGVGLSSELLDALVAAGLDHIQLSFQDEIASLGNELSGVRSHEHKLRAAGLIRSRELAFTINLVIHRANVDRLESMIETMAGLGAGKLEIAHVQYVGWAFRNRGRLLPTRAQLDHSIRVVEKARERLKGRVRIDFVTPDYHARYPKTCMGGWARKLLLVNPQGLAMPCHSATILPGLDLPNVRNHDLGWIWGESPAFRKYRGAEWLPEPCRSCERKEQDLGGCRCQAFLITGDPGVTDPVCSRSPDRPRVDQVIGQVIDQVGAAWIYRKSP